MALTRRWRQNLNWTPDYVKAFNAQLLLVGIQPPGGFAGSEFDASTRLQTRSKEDGKALKTITIGGEWLTAVECTGGMIAVGRQQYGDPIRRTSKLYLQFLRQDMTPPSSKTTFWTLEEKRNPDGFTWKYIDSSLTAMDKSESREQPEVYLQQDPAGALLVLRTTRVIPHVLDSGADYVLSIHSFQIGTDLSMRHVAKHASSGTVTNPGGLYAPGPITDGQWSPIAYGPDVEGSYGYMVGLGTDVALYQTEQNIIT